MCLDYDEDMLAYPIVILLCSLLVSSCSSLPGNEVHSLKKLILYNLAVRRPVSLGARSGAIPGEMDYETYPKPDVHFDCVPLKRLYKEMDFFKLRKCFQTVNQSTWNQDVIFELRRSKVPFWKRDEPELEDDDPFEEEPDSAEAAVPSCIRVLLDKIPIPREIFFQSNDEGSVNCYSSRIDIDEDDTLKIKSNLQHHELRIAFPLKKIPETEEEMTLLLATWSLAPFFDTSSQLNVKLVSTSMCGKCMGEKNMFLSTDKLPPQWP